MSTIDYFGRLQPIEPLDVEAILRLFRFHVDGVEVTQAIQYYHAADHLTDSADRAPTTRCTLVARKPAWVRVYVRSGPPRADFRGVTATVEVAARHTGSCTPSPLAPRSHRGSVTAETNPATRPSGERSPGPQLRLDRPTSCAARLSSSHRVTRPGAPPRPRSLSTSPCSRRCACGDHGRLQRSRARAPNAAEVTIPAAPTVANPQTTSDWTLRTFPVRARRSTERRHDHLDDAALGRAALPGVLHAELGHAQLGRCGTGDADGNRPDVLYYGLIASACRWGRSSGASHGRVSPGSYGDGVTMAHELGHHCGLPHAPCGTSGRSRPIRPTSLTIPGHSTGVDRRVRPGHPNGTSSPRHVQGHDVVLRTELDLALQQGSPHQQCGSRSGARVRRSLWWKDVRRVDP